jgi:hypothetical protein
MSKSSEELSHFGKPLAVKNGVDCLASKTVQSSSPGACRCTWLEEAQKQLWVIARLSDNWDSNGAPAPDPRILSAGYALLNSLCDAGALPKPNINPTPQGGVQFEWEAGPRYFEVELVSEKAATYYWRDYSAGEQHEGTVFEQDPLDTIVDYARRVGTP